MLGLDLSIQVVYSFTHTLLWFRHCCMLGQACMTSLRHKLDLPEAHRSMSHILMRRPIHLAPSRLRQLLPIPFSHFPHVRILFRRSILPRVVVQVLAVETIYRKSNAHHRSTANDDEEDNEGGSYSESHVVSLREPGYGSLWDVHVVGVAARL